MTSQKEITQWTDKAKALGATHLLVVCDTFSHEDYPVAVFPADSLAAKQARYDDVNMQRIMETIPLLP